MNANSVAQKSRAEKRNRRRKNSAVTKVDTPKVSVILSSYNQAPYVGGAIQSVLGQTFTDFELLIYDDGSVDNSQEIIKSFTDPRIKFFLYKENRGPRLASLEAERAARGKYIAVHHSDDVWRSDKLEKQVAFLDAHKEYIACFSYANFIDENGNLQELDEHDFYKNVFNQPNRSRAQWLRYFFYNANCLCHPSVLIRRNAYEEYNLLDVAGLWQLPDFYMWIKICFHADFYVMPENLVEFRLRRNRENMSAMSLEKLIRTETEAFFIMSQFVAQFTDDKFFLEVFPEAEKFFVNGKIIREFAFAQLCLESSTHFSSTIPLVGLTLLKKILSSEAAAEVKKLYGYDEKSFLADTGRYDIFGLRQKFSTIHSCIFFDTGNGFNETEMVEQFIFVEQSGDFFARYNFSTARTVKILRFDPDDKFISLKLQNFTINGQKYSAPSYSNSFEIVNGFYRFINPDPQISFELDEEAGRAENFVIEIQGKIELNYPMTLSGEVETILKNKYALSKTIAELQAKNAEQEGIIVALQKTNVDKEHSIAALQTTNADKERTIAALQKTNADKERTIAALQKTNADKERTIAALQKTNADKERSIVVFQRANAEKKATIVALQKMNADKERSIAELRETILEQKNELAELQDIQARQQREIFALQDSNAILGNQIQELTLFREAVLSSNSWKITEPLRNIGSLIRGGMNDKNSPSSGTDKLLSVGRIFYKALPINDKTKVELKDKFYQRFAPILKDTQRYKIWYDSKNPVPIEAPLIQAKPINFVGELSKQPGKIAVHAHIFYLDLLEEIAGYFSNMPYKFDALISIVDASAEQRVRAAFGKISNVEKCIIRVVENRGRDVAPFIIGFGDLLLNYEFIAHVHSKKSLYTGNEQTNWRHNLLDALLGDSERIGKIFQAFEDNPNLGLIYPQPAENVPYQAFTWMSNGQVGPYLLKRIGVPLNITDYFDFPAGTMFWARTKALRKFVTSGLTIEDFPPEQGQNDGTLAHAFERSLALTVNSEGMDFYEFDWSNDSCTVNIGSKNLWQYWNKTGEEIGHIINTWEYVSFDIFDTLIMRRVAKPALVNELIAIKVERMLGRDFDFKHFRLQAESDAREKFSGDVTIDEIYQSFSALTNLDVETCRKIRALEVSTELELVLPRGEMVGFLNKAVAAGKKVWLISDMYLRTPDIERLLNKCGVFNYNRLMISCETKMRKDTAEIWNYLAAQNLAGKLIHVGDNETSDVQLVGDRHFDNFHVMSSINLFSQIPFGRMVLARLGRSMSLYAGIFLGTILARKFNNPFLLKGSGKFQIDSFRELGYIFYGAPILTFMLWLIQKSQSDGVKRILFLARDGYFLQPLYKLTTRLLKVEELPNEYFYASRRAVTVASIRKISNAYELCNLKFAGTVKKFFETRLEVALGDDTEISLPEKKADGELVKKIMDEHSAEILSRAALERANYEKYLASIGGSFNNVGIVDMGYSGTIQYYLQRLMNVEFTGYYFATSVNNRFGESAAERIRGCFTENDDYGKTNSAVYKYQLLFESILTSPDAQLKYFDNGEPVFGNPEPAQFHIEDIREIHEGIKDFCSDVLEHFGDYLLSVPLDLNFIDAWTRAFVDDEEILSPQLRDIFNFDDEYCNTFTGNALDLYLHGLNGVSFKLK